MLPLWVYTSYEVRAAELKVLAAVISGTFSPKHGAGWFLHCQKSSAGAMGILSALKYGLRLCIMRRICRSVMHLSTLTDVSGYWYQLATAVACVKILCGSSRMLN